MSKLVDMAAIFVMVSVGIYVLISSVIAIDKAYYRPDECQQQIDLIRYMG